MKYKYLVNSTEVFPLNNGVANVIYEKPIPSSVIFEKKLDGSVILNSTADFNFKTQQTVDPTEELNFIIQQKCNGVWQDFITLVFTVAEAEFDDDACIIKISTKTKNTFRKDIPINIVIQQNRIKCNNYITGVSDAYTSGSVIYPQAFYFSKTILSVAQKSNSKITGIISDFFQINPINVSTDCLPGIYNYWSNMAFCALSDVQNPLPSNLARTEFITFQELMDDINALFDVYWFIDANGVLRIEHRIFFEGIVGLDLTTSNYSKWLLNTNKYHYDIDGFPRTEKLTVAGSIQYAQLTYGYFGTINKNNNQLSKSTKKIHTDYANIYYFGGSSATDGVFLFACYPEVSAFNCFWAFTEIPIGEVDLSPADQRMDSQNMYLTPHVLMYRLHTYGKYDSGALFESLTVYDASATALLGDSYPQGQYRAGGLKSQSVRPVILQDEIKIPFCCDDVFETDKQIVTSFGTGVLESAAFDMKTEMLKLQIKYPAPEFDFDPSHISGLDAWFRGDSGITYGVAPFYPVSQWDDSSGNGRDAVQATGINQPNWHPTYNGILFKQGGPTTWLETISAVPIFPSKRGTVFCLFRLVLSGSSPSEQMTIISNKGPVFYWDMSYASGLVYAFNYNSASAPTAFIYPQNFYQNQHLMQVRRISDTEFFCKDNSKDIPEYQYIDAATNGLAIAGDLINPAIIPNDQPSSTNLIIGSNAAFSTGNAGECIISEIIIYDHVLTDEECEKVELYLAKKGYYTRGSQVGAHF